MVASRRLGRNISHIGFKPMTIMARIHTIECTNGMYWFANLHKLPSIAYHNILHCIVVGYSLDFIVALASDG